MVESEISKAIVDATIEVHRTLGGPGLLESVYQAVIAWELLKRGLEVEREKIAPITYKGYQFGSPLWPDLLVNKKVIVECKATANYNNFFGAQVLTCLRLTGLKLGLVINFGKRLFKNGILRVANVTFVQSANESL